MTHVAPIPDKPPFTYGLTAFQTALSDILLCVIVERARVVTTLRTEIQKKQDSAPPALCSYHREFSSNVVSQRMYYIGHSCCLLEYEWVGHDDDEDARA